MNTSIANPELRKVVLRLKETIQSRQQADLVAKELSNCISTSTQQLEALEALKREFGEAFSEFVTLDSDILGREGVNITQFVEAAKVWLEEHAGWVAHHKQNLAWIDNPPKGISLPEIEDRIEAGRKSASSLLARAEKLDAQLKKI